jgi:hypothetical protein
MRALGRLLIVLVLLAVVLVAADFGIAAVAEQRAAEHASEVLDAPTEVTIRGWPRGLQVVTGEVQSVDLHARDVPMEGGPTIDRLDVTLDRLQVRWDDLWQESERLPPAEEGRFSAELSEASVRELLGGVADLAELSLVDGAIRLGVGGLELEATVEARDGAVAIVPQDVVSQLVALEGFRIDLSDQPGAPRVEEAEVADGRVIVRGTLEDVSAGTG